MLNFFDVWGQWQEISHNTYFDYNTIAPFQGSIVLYCIVSVWKHQVLVLTLIGKNEIHRYSEIPEWTLLKSGYLPYSLEKIKEKDW